MPKRIQRKRVKGWRMPSNTVSVTRPSVWGNPFVVTLTNDGFWEVDCKDKNLTNALSEWIWQHTGPLAFKSRADATRFALAMYRAWVILLVVHGDVDLAGLRGKDLACWCREGEPCHADVLLEMAGE